MTHEKQSPHPESWGLTSAHSTPHIINIPQCGGAVSSALEPAGASRAVNLDNFTSLGPSVFRRQLTALLLFQCAAETWPWLWLSSVWLNTEFHNVDALRWDISQFMHTLCQKDWMTPKFSFEEPSFLKSAPLFTYMGLSIPVLTTTTAT